MSCLSGITSALSSLVGGANGTNGPVANSSTNGGSSIFSQMLAAKQNDIDMQKKQLETQIAIDQKEQEQVANMKKKAIEDSTPKYTAG